MSAGGLSGGSSTVFTKPVIKTQREVKDRSGFAAFYVLIERKGQSVWCTGGGGGICQAKVRAARCRTTMNYIHQALCHFAHLEQSRTITKLIYSFGPFVIGMSHARKMPSSLNMAVIDLMLRPGSSSAPCATRLTRFPTINSVVGFVQQIFRWYDL